MHVIQGQTTRCPLQGRKTDWQLLQVIDQRMGKTGDDQIQRLRGRLLDLALTEMQ
jgi:hypothetical protein